MNTQAVILGHRLGVTTGWSRQLIRRYRRVYVNRIDRWMLWHRVR